MVDNRYSWVFHNIVFILNMAHVQIPVRLRMENRTGISRLHHSNTISNIPIMVRQHKLRKSTLTNKLKASFVQVTDR